MSWVVNDYQDAQPIVDSDFYPVSASSKTTSILSLGGDLRSVVMISHRPPFTISLVLQKL